MDIINDNHESLIAIDKMSKKVKTAQVLKATLGRISTYLIAIKNGGVLQRPEVYCMIPQYDFKKRVVGILRFNSSSQCTSYKAMR